jgi:predicted lipoprotein with Yx(FWY)xxD motif
VGTRKGSIRIGFIAALAVVVALAVPMSGIAGARHVATSKPTVQTRTIKGLGTVLVNSRGLTLYMFVKDKQKKVTCTSAGCTALWPPVKLRAGQKPTAGGAAKKKLLGSDKSSAGYRVVTYNHWPLYTYYLDRKPGQATGQRVNNSGGLWYVLSPAGKVITKKP